MKNAILAILLLIPFVTGYSVANNSLEKIFTAIYLNGEWGRNENGEGTSGSGSTVEYTKEYVRFLEDFLRNHKIKSVIDIGCGDWQFSKNVNWDGVEKYIGYDVVKFLIDRNTAHYANKKISFVHADAVHVELPRADLLICKEVLQHLPIDDIKLFLSQIKKFKYCIIVNDIEKDTKTSENRDIPAGHYRTLDITKNPFNVKAKRMLSYETKIELKQVWLIENK